MIPNWWDILIVILFSMVIFRWAVQARLDEISVNHQLERDAHQLNYEHTTA